MINLHELLKEPTLLYNTIIKVSVLHYIQTNKNLIGYIN